MHSSEEKTGWVRRWRYEIAAHAIRPGIWRLKGGGYFVRARVCDRNSGKEIVRTRVLRDAATTVAEAQEAQDQLRHDARSKARLKSGKLVALPLWSEFAASLLESKVAEAKLKSAASRRRWSDALTLLLPKFGTIRVDELRYVDVAEWRETLVGWLHRGMPSRRARDAGKNKIVRLSPATANGWISIFKVICASMKRRYELDRDPADPLEFFAKSRTYTREQPNSLNAQQVPQFLAKMKELHPSHYAMTFLGFITGARPSTLRPLRRAGPEMDIDWTEGFLLLRRSHVLGEEIMDQTKTGLDQEIPLPTSALDILREHIAALPEGKMSESTYLFPSTKGGLRARSVLDKPFRDVLAALGWSVKLTPRGLRRTFQDLARNANVHDVVTRAISGHATERMQRHYSTAQREEMREAVGKVISIATRRVIA